MIEKPSRPYAGTRRRRWAQTAGRVRKEAPVRVRSLLLQVPRQSHGQGFVERATDGLPRWPQYSKCSNIDNADRLQGKLSLIVGELDNNVSPESTMRLVDALIKTDKDFDLLVVPGGGHGMDGAYGARRMRNFL